VPPAAHSYAPLHLPSSNPTGVLLAFFSVVLGFASIWHIWWMAIVGLLGAVVVGLVQAWRPDHEVVIPAHEVAAFYSKQSAGEIAA
jgi:cytochrome o ubiquinol oxidase subunit 1